MMPASTVPARRMPAVVVTAAARTRRREMPKPRLGQAVCWQLAVAAVVASVPNGWQVVAGVAIGSVAAVTVTAAWWHGRWLYEWAAIAMTFLLRRRHALLPQTAERAAATIGALHSDAHVRDAELSGTDAGVVSTESGLTTVLPCPGPPPPDLESTDAACSIRVVAHAGVNKPPRWWVAIHTPRALDGYTDDEVLPALGNAVRRLRRRIDAAPLGARDLAATVLALAHGNAGHRVDERWSSVHIGPVRQVAVALRGPVTEAFVRTVLAAAPAAATTLSHPAAAAPDRAVLRVASPQPPTLDAALQAVAAIADQHDIRVERLDGRHAAGVAATLPIGGALS